MNNQPKSKKMKHYRKVGPVTFTNERGEVKVLRNETWARCHPKTNHLILNEEGYLITRKVDKKNEITGRRIQQIP
jgi:hypothetical protein